MFSNAIEFDSFYSTWCDHCVKEPDCDIIAMLMNSDTMPDAIFEDERGNYCCSCFSNDEGIVEWLKPKNEDPNQTKLEL